LEPDASANDVVVVVVVVAAAAAAGSDKGIAQLQGFAKPARNEEGPGSREEPVPLFGGHHNCNFIVANCFVVCCLLLWRVCTDPVSLVPIVVVVVVVVVSG
jgi:hypothetical protein